MDTVIQNYNPKYWSEVARDFVNYYKLEKNARILDVGCGKGFMLYDFKKQFPNFMIYGIDISDYAIENSLRCKTKFKSRKLR